MTRTYWLLAPGLAALTCLPATAAPVTTARSATAHFVVFGDGEEDRVGVVAVPGRLQLSVSRCIGNSCTAPTYWEGPLAGSFTVDEKVAVAHLRTSVGGRELVVDWSPAPASTVVLGGGGGSGDGEQNVVEAYRNDPAVVRLVVDGQGCTTTGGVGDRVRVATPDDSSGAAAPLSQVRLTAGTLACPG